MCGIGGFQTFAPSAADYLNTVVKIQHHRGPDANGTWHSPDNRTGLCHNRLAIVDLSPGGAQPMQSANGKLTISFNGEIYNWRELRAELMQSGHVFRSTSDTEVLLTAYQQWGVDCLDKFQGMYAFAIYDAAEDILFLARDSVGKKPLLYAELATGFFFASELPALQQFAHAPINRDAVLNSLVHNLHHLPEPFTAYQNIFKLRPGHAMVIKGGKIIRQWRHYNPLEKTNVPITAEGLRGLVADAVACRRVADVPVSALLSGGVDSTFITALMREQEPQGTIKTYALGRNADDEDLRRARLMAARIGTEHQEFYFEPERQWQVLGDLLRQHGEPIALLPMVHAAELFRHIRADGGRVVLVGHGADEIFYGYNGHWRTLMVSLFLQFGGGMLGKIGAPMPADIKTIAAARPGMRKAALYTERAKTLAAQILRTKFSEYVSHEMAAWGQLFSGHDYLDESNFVGLMVENQHSITIASDLPAMMHSVEARAPFLDRRVMAFGWQTPWWKKLVPGKYHQQKYILRQAAAPYIPAEILNAPKRGFGFGISLHELLTGVWRGMAEDLLSQENEWLDRTKIAALWQACKNGDSTNSSLLFKVMMMQRWLAAQ